ncbi:MAG: hypothetical protein ACTTHG_04365 [Treponemataceae bacterium]
MSKKLLTVICSLLCFSLIFFGCKSKPDKESEEVPVEDVVPEEVEQDTSTMSPEEMARLANEEFLSALGNKEKIEQKEFQGYDQASYEEGLKALEDYKALVDSGAPIEEQLAMAKKANSAFKTVLDKAYMDLAEKKKAEVVEVRKNALAIKADKAGKKEFDSAQLAYMSAEDAFVNKSYEASYESYCKAFDLFSSLYEDISTKRALAEQAIERAKQKTAQVDEFAVQADEIAPLPDEAEAQSDDSNVEAE